MDLFGEDQVLLVELLLRRATERVGADPDSVDSFDVVCREVTGACRIKLLGARLSKLW